MTFTRHPIYLVIIKKALPLHTHSGCSSARLEYASGGRVVAGSNPVIPTVENQGVKS